MRARPAPCGPYHLLPGEQYPSGPRDDRRGSCRTTCGGQHAAPGVAVAIRGTISRTDLVLAATYRQVWWPPATEVKYLDGELPVWHESSGNYLDPATGEVLPTWD